VSLFAGFLAFLQLLVNYNDECLCDVPVHAVHARSHKRATGWRTRKFHTPLGSSDASVPRRRGASSRISICERAGRVAPLILDALSHIHALGSARVSRADGALPDAARISAGISPLAKLPWTQGLLEDLRAALTAQLIPALAR